MENNSKIVGRAKEITKLNKILESSESEFLAVYGRRRVGKTFLIRQHFKSQIVFDFTGSKDASRSEQLANFFAVYLNKTQGKKETKPPKTWFEAFGYLANYLEGLKATKTKHVVFIDEMPWIDSPKSGFVPALEYFWNQHAAKLENVLLVACGSASSWIRKKLISARGGLYNRVSQRIKLSPFSLQETELFLKSKEINLPQYQILELYMTMGGIPFYLNEVVKGQSSTQIINNLCFSKEGLLFDEYAQLYYSIFKNAENHVSIIEALAAKPQGLSRTDISKITKIAEGSLTRALEELLESDFVILIPPFHNKKKDTLYKLIDLYSLFYLKFIAPQRHAGANSWEILSQQSSFSAWSGYAYENICLMHISQIKKALGIESVITQQSSWKFTGDETYPGAQIDLLIDRADQCVNLCEAKFTKENFIITKEYAEKLRIKKTIFKHVTDPKKALFTTLLTTYPALKNQYYQEEIVNEVTMDKLFEN
ncbi:ATP-binding protein [Lacihabitans sp. LS3-19]|uniref:AAA family ATPase n=1 Tax=Lacihabitans sp. LS3-19 TaxID=2487335 RepID=UPI0020CDC2AC|nr:ATP-binding protein [Lacihabitans sp. LS3-19]MCP9766497.1 ATP-binding protein [Lacihabitans sp. LS3-19]